MRKGIVALIAFGWLIGLGIAAGEEVYVYVDEEGVIHLTNAPTHRGFRPLWSKDLSRDPSPPPGRYASLIQAIAKEHRVDPALIRAIIQAESNFDPHAVSRKGAMGLMQLMPEAAWELAVQDTFDPQANIAGGVRHLKRLLDRFKGNVALALAAYNAGENAVLRHGGIPPYRETKEYVNKVLSLYRSRASWPKGPVKVAIEASPSKVYRSFGPDGSIRYSNLPPLTPRRGTGPLPSRPRSQDEADGR